MSVPEVGIDRQGRLAARHVYPWHEAIGDLPGARFHGRGTPPFWLLPPTPGAAAALLTVLAGTGARVSPQVMEMAREGYGRAEARSVAADESAPLPDLPWHEWLKTDPWSHQRRGIDYLMKSSAAAIGAGMGTGKSLMIVGAMNARAAQRVVLVSPENAFGVFPRQIRIHSVKEWHVVNGQRRTRTGSIARLSLKERWTEQSATLSSCRCGKPHMVIVGYSAMTQDPLASADLNRLGVDLVVYDECHRLKSAGGAASWTAKSWVSQVPLRWGLSGTLMPQGPDDIYGTYRALDPSIFGLNKTDFRAEFIAMGTTKDGRSYPKDVQKTKRLEFSRRFHSIAYIPKVDLRLPPVTHVIRSFELEPTVRKLYNSIRDTGIAEISSAVAASGGVVPAEDELTVAPANAGVEMLRFAQITGGSVTADDGTVSVVSTAKVTALSEVMEEIGCRRGGQDGKSAPEPLVVFCRFRADLAAIEKLASQRKLTYREVSGSRKDGLDDDSRMHPDCDVLGVQIQSGSEAVDFTRTRYVAWYSVGFELWRFQQASKRAHRPGQTRQTTNIYLIAEQTIDSVIYSALARRENVVNSCVTAYLKHVAEQSGEDLPEMEVEPGSLPVAPVALPPWLADDDRPPRTSADPERDAEAAALTSAGLAGL